MQRKPLDFLTYKNLQKMSYNALCRWVISVYTSGYQDGKTAADAGLVRLSEDEVRKALRSVPGVGEKRADQIMKALQAAQERKGSKEQEDAKT